jgi:hypothetical protein
MARLEGRSHNLALAAMELSLAAENAIADGRAKGIVDADAFIEIVSMFNQDAVNMLRAVEQNHRERPETHAADISLAGHALQETQAITIKFKNIADKRVPAGKVKRFLAGRGWFHLCNHEKLL